MNFCRSSISPAAAAPAKAAALRLPGNRIRNGIAICLALAILTLGQSARAAQRTWNNTGTDFNSAGSWTGGVPTGSNNAAFNTAAVTQPNLSASLSIAGFVFTTTTASGYDITSTNGASFTLTGQTAGSAAQSSNSDSAAIFAANTSGTNTFDVNLILAPASGTTSTFNQAAGGTLIVNGIVSGVGIALNLPGAGTVQLNGLNTYSGGTTVIAGTLAIGNNGALGSGNLTLGGTSASTPTILAFNAPRTISNNIILASVTTGNATIGGSNDLTLNGTLTNSGGNRTLSITNTGLTTQAGNVFLSEVTGSGRTLTITGSGNIVLGGVIANFSGGAGTAGNLTFNSTYTGTATINGTNTYSGATTLSSGTFVLGNSAAFGTSTVGWNGATVGAVSVSASTDLSGANAIANTSTIGGNPTFTGSNNIELSGTVTNNVSNDTVTNNMSGGAILTFSGTVNLSNNATAKTLILGGTGNTTISGVIANGGGSTSSLGYSGSGRLTLTNANTYSGSTSVTGGTLLVTNTTGSGTGTSSVVVSNAGTTLSGGTTTGVGGITGTVAINPSATLSPGTSGNGAGTTAILHTGALTLVGGSNFAVDLNNTTAGSGYDQVISSGAIVLTGANLLVTASNSLSLLDKFFILDNSSLTTNTGTFAQGATVTATNGYVFAINYLDSDPADGTPGNDISLTLTAIPEPSTWIGGALALAAIGLMQRKRLAKRFRVIRHGGFVLRRIG